MPPVIAGRDAGLAIRRPTAGRPTTPTLARAVVARDEQALAELYRRHVSPCLGLARRVLIDRTLGEEVVQEVFVRMWRDPDRFDATRGSMRAFLLAQVHGRAVDVLRAESARRAREERQALRSPTVDLDLEREVMQLTEAEAVRTALGEPGRRRAGSDRARLLRRAHVPRGRGDAGAAGGHGEEPDPGGTPAAAGRADRGGGDRVSDQMPAPDASELDSLLGAYALDALDDADRALVDEYLRHNAAARAEVDEMRETAATLALLPSVPADAPPAMWEHIAGTIAADQARDTAAVAALGDELARHAGPGGTARCGWARCRWRPLSRSWCSPRR